MVDEVDYAEERMEFDLSVKVQNIQQKAGQFNPGQPGECYLCGEEFQRVITVEKDGERILACGGCRDRHGIK